ncbi:DUF308 domain-containing protein [Crossiella cryophila]|uniref:Uncharacterized membrane protein HdeD (DUF308 family) n=1 Tax=Crossiella cryophila TaxID=43355 RepID=A0A7W7C9Q2_9PSEU|nr:DUF308 domain-containing protein [Crossiella cryophila]MBB4677128.1 uncharacterized membrane protein HdeD (DUF308 family) [Crossiella cryophila]
MLELLRGRHRLMTIRGSVAIVFALLAFFAWPEDADWVVQFAVLIAYLLAEGVFALLFAFGGKEAPALDRVLFALPGFLLLAGITLTAASFAITPLISLFGVVIVSAGWPIINGIGQALVAVRVKDLYCRIGFAISGTLSIVVGVLVMNVSTEQASLWTLLAWYALVSGLIFVALGVRFSRRGR